jgi:ADP-ribose pyrophosphatase YjhB (NUDIX family)
VPGGRVESGESDEQAVAREVAEETGLEVRVGRLIGSVRRPAPGGAMFDIRDYAATVIRGTLTAGDDADEARWVEPAEMARLALTDGLAEALTEWGVLG